MQYEVATPEEYIEKLDNDWRKEKLQLVRQIILDAAPELEEAIRYKMLGYKSGEELVFSLNAQKNYVSFYVGNISKIDPDGKLLKGLNLGKGCVRISKSVDISKTGLNEFISLAVELWESGHDINC